jgi:hypothetical protein
MSQDFKKLLRVLYDEFGDVGVELVMNQGAEFVRNRMAAHLSTPDPRNVGSTDGEPDSTRRATSRTNGDASESDTETHAGKSEGEGDTDRSVSYDDAEGFTAVVEDHMGHLATTAIMSPVDVVGAVENMILMAGEVRKFEEAQITKRMGIAAERDVAIANIRAQREVLQAYLARAFDERAENFSRLFDVVDSALDTNNMQALAMGLDSVVKLAASSPFKDLRSIEETTTALTDPDHEWDF